MGCTPYTTTTDTATATTTDTAVYDNIIASAAPNFTTTIIHAVTNDNGMIHWC